MNTKLVVLSAAVLIAWALKHHYAGARAEDLRWMLDPTAAVVGAATETTFAWQPGEGYFSRDQLFLIEKSCAGVNFMIAAFGVLLFALLHRVDSRRAGGRVLGLGLLASYVVTVLVNAVRIALAIKLAAHPLSLAAFDAGDIHRVEGILVYFGGLCLFYEIVQRLDGGASMVRCRTSADTSRSKTEP